MNTDLRKDLGRLNEGQADLVKKDDLGSRMKSVWDSLKELRADNAGLSALKERSAMLEQQVRAGDQERKEIVREFQRLREVRAVEEERRELARELQRLRERLAVMEGRQAAPSTSAKPDMHGE